MTDKDPTNPVGLARFARDYYDAAVAANDVLGTRLGYEISAPPPVMEMVAQSIELVLKAYLRSQGYSLSDLREKGHNLEDCWQAAADKGIKKHVELTETDANVLGLLSELHASTELRYIKTGYGPHPLFGPLQELTTKLLDAICPLVGFR